ncbi:reverse transcriptase, partial [Operophtera brumata]
MKTSVNEIRKLCDTADIVCLQETWLLPHDISYLGEIHEDFGYAGTSAVDVSSDVLQGRPFGGVAILWRKALFYDVSVLQSGNLMRTIVIPIVKNKTGDVSDKYNYRPISLATVTAK